MNVYIDILAETYPDNPDLTDTFSNTQTIYTLEVYDVSQKILAQYAQYKRQSLENLLIIKRKNIQN